MTYRQIFDEAVGEPPPTSVDIDRVMAGEERRTRLRRAGAYGTAAAAVLAVVLGAGVITGGPAPTAPATPPAATGQPSGVEADRQRIRAAMLAAIDREAPGLRWVPGAERDRYQDWTGPTVTTPSWPVHQFSHLSASGWTGLGIAARGDVRARFSIEISTPKVGQRSESLTCPEHSRRCGTSTGPNGERIRYMDLDVRRARPGEQPTPLAHRSVEVRRPDGTTVWVQALSSSAEFLLSVPQMTAIGLDPALSLH